MDHITPAVLQTFKVKTAKVTSWVKVTSLLAGQGHSVTYSVSAAKKSGFSVTDSLTEFKRDKNYSSNTHCSRSLGQRDRK